MGRLIVRILITVCQGVVLSALISGCNSTKYLGADEFLLSNNKVKLKTSERIKHKREIKYTLSNLYEQEPNGKFFFVFPREYFYFKNKDATSKFKSWVRRKIGEPPAIYEVSEAQQTASDMKRYLNYKGYYNAEVDFETKVRGKHIEVTYIANPGKQFIVDTLLYESQDQKLDTILADISDRTEMPPGVGLDGELYEKERGRIRDYLQEHGYAFFYSNYFGQLEADTTVGEKKANLYMNVLVPPGDSMHQQYRVGEIYIYPEFDPRQDRDKLQDTLIHNMHFRSQALKFRVKPSAIAQQIYLKKGSLYQASKVDRTNRALSSLGTFRFVRIKEEIDSLQPGVINFHIELNPNKRLELGIDFELNYTNRSNASGSGNLIGFAINPSSRHRNLFGGGELLVTGLTIGAEVNPAGGRAFLNTIDIGAQTDLYFPKFIDYISLWKAFYKFGNLFRKKPDPEADEVDDPFRLYDLMKEEAASRLTLSYNYLRLIDFYDYNLLNASFGYDVQRPNNTRYFINHVGIDYLQPNSDSAFQVILDQNPFLERSFGNQLFVGLLFREFNYSHTSRPNTYGESYYIGGFIEVGGAEVWAANAIANSITGKRDTFSINEVAFSQYFTLGLDFRYYRQLTESQQFVARINMGIARPFGFTSDVPYVKQFFVGGPNDIRAWPARGLGPGGYEDPLTQDQSNRLLFYQAGDFKLEFNLEYRFDIFWMVKGALFLDGGNVWTVRPDPARCGSQFSFRQKEVSYCDAAPTNTVDAFYKQIALGSGFGLRLDLSFFVFRLDMGLKIRNPFPSNGNPATANPGNYWVDPTQGIFIRNLNYNFGLGYPF